MKKFLYVHFSGFQCVRKYLGGRWVRDRKPGHMWVSFDHSELPWDLVGWPLKGDFEHEEWK